MKDLYHQKSPSNYQIHQASREKRVYSLVFDPKHETFIVHILSLNSTLLNIHLSHRPQIASLIAKEASIKVSAKYADFVDVFSSDLASKLPKHIEINNHTIKLVNG